MKWLSSLIRYVKMIRAEKFPVFEGPVGAMRRVFLSTLERPNVRDFCCKHKGLKPRLLFRKYHSNRKILLICATARRKTRRRRENDQRRYSHLALAEWSHVYQLVPGPLRLFKRRGYLEVHEKISILLAWRICEGAPRPELHYEKQASPSITVLYQTSQLCSPSAWTPVSVLL